MASCPVCFRDYASTIAGLRPRVAQFGRPFSILTGCGHTVCTDCSGVIRSTCPECRAAFTSTVINFALEQQLERQTTPAAASSPISPTSPPLQPQNAEAAIQPPASAASDSAEGQAEEAGSVVGGDGVEEEVEDEENEEEGEAEGEDEDEDEVAALAARVFGFEFAERFREEDWEQWQDSVLRDTTSDAELVLDLIGEMRDNATSYALSHHMSYVPQVVCCMARSLEKCEFGDSEDGEEVQKAVRVLRLSCKYLSAVLRVVETKENGDNGGEEAEQMQEEEEECERVRELFTRLALPALARIMEVWRGTDWLVLKSCISPWCRFAEGMQNQQPQHLGRHIRPLLRMFFDAVKPYMLQQELIARRAGVVMIHCAKSESMRTELVRIGVAELMKQLFAAHPDSIRVAVLISVLTGLIALSDDCEEELGRAGLQKLFFDILRKHFDATDPPVRSEALQALKFLCSLQSNKKRFVEAGGIAQAFWLLRKIASLPAPERTPLLLSLLPICSVVCADDDVEREFVHEGVYDSLLAAITPLMVIQSPELMKALLSLLRNLSSDGHLAGYVGKAEGFHLLSTAGQYYAEGNRNANAREDVATILESMLMIMAVAVKGDSVAAQLGSDSNVYSFYVKVGWPQRDNTSMLTHCLVALVNLLSSEPEVASAAAATTKIADLLLHALTSCASDNETALLAALVSLQMFASSETGAKQLVEKGALETLMPLILHLDTTDCAKLLQRALLCVRNIAAPDDNKRLICSSNTSIMSVVIQAALNHASDAEVVQAALEFVINVLNLGEQAYFCCMEASITDLVDRALTRFSDDNAMVVERVFRVVGTLCNSDELELQFGEQGYIERLSTTLRNLAQRGVSADVLASCVARWSALTFLDDNVIRCCQSSSTLVDTLVQLMTRYSASPALAMAANRIMSNLCNPGVHLHNLQQLHVIPLLVKILAAVPDDETDDVKRTLVAIRNMVCDTASSTEFASSGGVAQICRVLRQHHDSGPADLLSQVFAVIVNSAATLPRLCSDYASVASLIPSTLARLSDSEALTKQAAWAISILATNSNALHQMAQADALRVIGEALAEHSDDESTEKLMEALSKF